ncbi:hypothetical protein [Mycolicibacterium porcinum]|uniref:hypothetical protein n=1 Tax=Mycolicibacterium porcinum TaxID=39693 RepID=UPI0013F4E72E|nr:hypothetical protein [Mycolicibacterium porcinum]
MPMPGPNDEAIRKLEESLPQSFWDSLIKMPPGWQPPPIELVQFDDIADLT